MQTEFFRLTKDDDRVDADLRRFLSQSYELKSIADYFAGDVNTVSSQEATEAVATAKRFVAHVEALF